MGWNSPIKPVFKVLGALMGALRILMVSLLSMVVASAILGMIIAAGGLGTSLGVILTAPFIMVYGWFYIPVVIFLHFAAYGLWPRFRSRPHGKRLFAFAGSVLAAVLFAVIGVKEQGSFWLFTAAYAVAAFVPAFLVLHLITAFRDEDDHWRTTGSTRGAGAPSHEIIVGR